jgi:hypothetical protein
LRVNDSQEEFVDHEDIKSDVMRSNKDDKDKANQNDYFNQDIDSPVKKNNKSPARASRY